MNFKEIRKSKENDTIWFLMTTLYTQSEHEVSKWSSYNLLINEARAKKSHWAVLQTGHVYIYIYIYEKKKKFYRNF